MFRTKFLFWKILPKAKQVLTTFGKVYKMILKGGSKLTARSKIKKGGKMKINLEDSKGQIITSVEISNTLERDIDGFYEVKEGQ